MPNLIYYSCAKCNSHLISEASGTTSVCAKCGHKTKHSTKELKVDYPTFLLPDDIKFRCDKEFELLFNKKTGYEFGVNVMIQYNELSYYRNKIDYCNNVTEIHHLFDSASTKVFGEQIAIESDIQGTGFTRGIAHIKFILATRAYKLS
jgi:DNA-directed RNA polymerase subunit RPC12/RpoP